MRRFHFTLQALHTLREREEQSALQEYSQALRAWEEARLKVAALQQELETTWGQRRQRLLGPCPAAELARLQAWCQTVEQQKQASEHAAKEARNKASQAHAKLVEARQARAVVDKLFENQRRRHERAQRRHEQRSLDEMVNHQNALTVLMTLSPEPLRS